MKAKRDAEHVTKAVPLRDSRSEGIQRSSPVSCPLSGAFAGRSIKRIAFDRPLDMWVGFLRQQAKKVRLWLDTSCGCSHVSAFVERQAEKLSAGFDAAFTRYNFTNFWRPQAEKLRVWSAAIHRRLSMLNGWLSALMGRCSRPILIGWCCFAAVVLLVSFVVHVSTFLGIDPMAKWPGVMLIHLAIFPPFIAAGSYASHVSGKDEKGQDRVFKSAPRWLQILTGVLFIYAFVNFVTFIVLVEGGNPSERDGKYVLHSHGTVIREISEAEYHQKQAYVVRGFSGLWMMFSCAALTMLSGTVRLRHRTVGASVPMQERTGRCAGADVREGG